MLNHFNKDCEKVQISSSSRACSRGRDFVSSGCVGSEWQPPAAPHQWQGGDKGVHHSVHFVVETDVKHSTDSLEQIK